MECYGYREEDLGEERLQAINRDRCLLVLGDFALCEEDLQRRILFYFLDGAGLLEIFENRRNTDGWPRLFMMR